MPGPSWPYTTDYPMVYPVGGDGSNAASMSNGLPVTFTTLVLGRVASAVSNVPGSFAVSAQSIANANASRRFLVFMSDSTTQTWLAFGTAAVSGAPAIRVQSNTVFRMDGSFVPSNSITAYCQSFVSFTLIEG